MQSRSQSLHRHANEGSGIIHRRKCFDWLAGTAINYSGYCGSTSLGFGLGVYKKILFLIDALVPAQSRANFYAPSGNRCSDMFAFLNFLRKLTFEVYNISSAFLSDKGPWLEALDLAFPYWQYTNLLYFDLYFNTACAAHSV